MEHQIPIMRGNVYTMEITGLGHNAEGVGKYEGFTVFVPQALPGEQVEVYIVEVKKTYARGKIRRVLRESPARIAAPCAIYNECGGCQMQHLKYEVQLEEKRNRVADAVKRIGGLDAVAIRPTLRAETPWQYRNKMQFPVGVQGGKIAIGCYAQGSHRIVQTENCLIQHEANNAILRGVREALTSLAIPAYDERTDQGIVRHIVGRVGAHTGEVMVAIVTRTEKLPQQRALIAALRETIPSLVGIVQNINPLRTNVIMGKTTRTLWGKSTICDRLDGLEFEISARSFFQVNTLQAEVLYREALRCAELSGRETVIDVYCGTGAITLFLAKSAKHVYGIELNEQAVRDAEQNAARNQIQNATFVAGDATDVMPKLYDEGIRADVIVVDPPRAGCTPQVLQTFAEMKPKRIVYVSCNPASLARDLAILAQLGYKAEEIQPVDMFPMTSSVESVTLITPIK